MNSNQVLELDTHACLHIGDTTIIASANYQDDGASCFYKIVGVLKEELAKQPCF